MKGSALRKEISWWEIITSPHVAEVVTTKIYYMNLSDFYLCSLFLSRQILDSFQLAQSKLYNWRYEKIILFSILAGIHGENKCDVVARTNLIGGLAAIFVSITFFIILGILGSLMSWSGIFRILTSSNFNFFIFFN